MLDPNIPFNKAITPDIPYGEPNWCYGLCDLEFCLNDQDTGPVLDCREYNVHDDNVPFEQTSSENTIESFFPLKDNHSVDSILSTTSDMDLNHESLAVTGITTENSIFTTGHSDQLEATIFNHESNPTNIEFNDVYSEEIEIDEKLGTTLPNPVISSLSDEDYYMIQVGSDMAVKQSQSSHFLELKPNYDLKKIDDFHSYLIDSYERAETSTNNNNNFQDIFLKAIGSTTIDSIIDENSYNMNKDIDLNEELTKEDIQLEWVNIKTNSDNNNIKKSTTTTTSTYSSSDSFLLEQSTQQHQTLSSSMINIRNYNNGDNYNNNNNGNNVTKSISNSTSNENNINRFRHHNSRNKEHELQKNVEHHRTTTINTNEQIDEQKKQQLFSNSNNNDNNKESIKNEYIQNKKKAKYLIEEQMRKKQNNLNTQQLQQQQTSSNQHKLRIHMNKDFRFEKLPNNNDEDDDHNNNNRYHHHNHRDLQESSSNGTLTLSLALKIIVFLYQIVKLRKRNPMPFIYIL